ncbi:class C sortase [Ruminobacter sp.]|uniref:class C sortase n=1 Tax=Ruminobacter sp. TaxID=2774296 RepID=UPI003868E629
MKNKLMNVLLVLIFAAGLSLLLYPTIADAYNSYLQSRIILSYSEQVDAMESAVYEAEMAEAKAYNARLLEREHPYKLTEELEEQYWQTLDISQVMGYVEIPTIDVTLPIAHGTEKDTLEDYVGHLKWSSLPVGGESTHSVISGHRGLPSSELFTNIDRLEIGDVFYIHVLGQTLEYWVDQINVVLPTDYTNLGIVEGRDYVTLMTCTPYGINSHRLLVRGIRIDRNLIPEMENVQIKNEIQSVDMMVLIPVILVILSCLVFVFLALPGGGSKKKRTRKEKQHGKE